jgi:8-oxo-dGTP pyrophosphatase MutT (NUDIX family)
MIYSVVMPATKISIDKAKPDKLFYFVANAVIYRPLDGRCLILKRGDHEKVHAGIWAVPGGKLEWGDFDLSKPTRMNGDVIDFENAIMDLLKREIKEEAGIEVEDELQFINDVFFVRPDGIPVILVKFAMRHKSGEVVIEEGAFSDAAWVNAQEVKSYQCIEGIADEIIRTIKLFG